MIFCSAKQLDCAIVLQPENQRRKVCADQRQLTVGETVALRPW